MSVRNTLDKMIQPRSKQPKEGEWWDESYPGPSDEITEVANPEPETPPSFFDADKDSPGTNAPMFENDNAGGPADVGIMVHTQDGHPETDLMLHFPTWIDHAVQSAFHRHIKQNSWLEGIRQADEHGQHIVHTRQKVPEAWDGWTADITTVNPKRIIDSDCNRRTVTIVNPSTNTSNVWLRGISQVAKGVGFLLPPGGSFIIAAQGEVWAIAETAETVLTYFWEYDR